MKKIIYILLLAQSSFMIAQTKQVLSPYGEKITIHPNANNGLSQDSGNTQLGGALVKPTTITTTAVNTLSLAGLQTGSSTDFLVTTDATGLVKRIGINALPATASWIPDGNNNGGVKTIGTNDGFDLPFETAGTEKMRLTTGGRLGIGIATPVAGIHIKSADALGNDIIQEGLGDLPTHVFINQGLSTTNPGYMGQISFGIAVGGPATANLCSIKAYYDGSGGNNLQFMNGAKTLQFTEYGALWIPGPAYATAFNVTSDARYKTDIQTVQNSLFIINSLRGATYKFNVEKFPQKTFAVGKQYGVIAQEIEKVLPELVESDKDGYKTVNYVGIIPVLIEAVKEQQKQIESKDKEIENINKRLERLEKLLAK